MEIIELILIILQQLPSDLYERTFNINPDTVYGILVVLLIFYAIWATLDARKDRKEFKELHKSTVKALQDNTDSNVKLSNKIDESIKENLRRK